ncbi:hypothetical protein PanWU01x14_008550, partial [Parasponia andersonii]
IKWFNVLKGGNPNYSQGRGELLLSEQKIDAAARKFWWTGSLDRNKFLALKAWDSLCQPKSPRRAWPTTNGRFQYSIVGQAY